MFLVWTDHVLTGPTSLSQVEQVGIIGEVMRTSLRFEEMSAEQARQEWSRLMPLSVINMLLNAWAAWMGQAAFLTSAVSAITGKPARTFRDWVSDHANRFER